MASANLHLPSAMQNVTMHVRITRERQFKVRLWIAIRLMKLATHVLGCGIDVETVETPFNRE